MNTALIAKFALAATLTLGLSAPAASLAVAPHLAGPTSVGHAAAGQITVR